MIMNNDFIRQDIDNRVDFIRRALEEAHADGIVFGSSGGKDSALVAILAKLATPNVLGVIMPCQSRRNYGMDRDDALTLHKRFDIETAEVDVTPIKEAFLSAVKDAVEEQSDLAYINVNPRLRMAILYNIAQRRNYLVAGTGNLSEITMGYFTKWGDGACDINPISDLTVTKVYEYLEYLDCPEPFLVKAPSAALSEDQTDEQEMGVSYKEIDSYIEGGEVSDTARLVIERRFRTSEHKRTGVKHYKAR